MSDPQDLMRKVKDLRDKAANEDDAAISGRLKRMADTYNGLAEVEAQKQAHPVDPAAIGELLTKGDG